VDAQLIDFTKRTKKRVWRKVAPADRQRSKTVSVSVVSQNPLPRIGEEWTTFAVRRSSSGHCEALAIDLDLGRAIVLEHYG
jgi:hypothetical protein